MEPWQHIPQFISAADVARLHALIERDAGSFKTAHGYRGLGPRYRFVQGQHIREHLPEVVALGERRVRPVVETFAGQPLVAPQLGRALRIQAFDGPHHSFRWHYDTSSYAALLTVENNNASETQMVSCALSRLVRPVYYPLFWIPQVFSLLPHHRIATQAGDLLVMRGTRMLHRGVALQADGRRVIIVYGYDEIGKRRQWLRERIGSALNTGY